MVQVKTDGILGLQNEFQNKKLVCFGAGRHFETVMALYAPYAVAEHVAFIIDNAPSLHGTYKIFQKKMYRILSPEAFAEAVNIDETVLLITNHFYSMEIIEQLDKMPELDGLSVYVGSFLSETDDSIPEFEIMIGEEVRIPKIIHFCWFGEGEIPKAYRRYMETWKKFCPEYKIKRWDESNFDVAQNKYMYQAYQHKKWAFVSDYARLKVIYEHGGIYLDCDVELLRSMDGFLSEKMFCGFEDHNHINLGLGYGAVAHHPCIKRLMEYYDTLDFVHSDGSLNLVPCPAYQTTILKEFGIRDNNTFQRLEHITVYPTEVFSPISGLGSGKITDKSHSVHHYGASWQPKEEMQKIRQVYQRYCKHIEEQAVKFKGKVIDD